MPHQKKYIAGEEAEDEELLLASMRPLVQTPVLPQREREREIQIANKAMKMYSTSYVLKEIQFQTY
jgi:hypothetical protein